MSKQGTKHFSYVNRLLAQAFLLERVDEETLIRNASELFFDGAKPRWLRPLAKRVAGGFADSPARPLRHEVVEVIKQSPSYRSAWAKGAVSLGSIRAPLPAKMCPGNGAPSGWEIPEATTLGGLARVLGIHLDDLGWLTSQTGKTEHYHLRWHRKKSASKGRLIEIPKPLLKDTQRGILENFLNPIPVHESACGFQRGKSILDYLGPHIRQTMVLKMDFQDFFPGISSGWVLRFFMTAGYPEAVASALTDLCTHAVAPEFLKGSDLDSATRLRLLKKHLPQGAPTSPALANLCSFRLDCRLSGLARKAGVSYTRYADDLLFSGDDRFRRQSEAFHIKVLCIAIEEGFRINTRKTRFMSASQQQFASGLVINESPALSRRDFDNLKAILTNCIRQGWKSQNRDNHPDFRAHLEGRIAWAVQVHPQKAEKLQGLFQSIAW